MTQSFALHEMLRRYFGFDSFRPAQEAIIRSLLAGRDTLAILPTGGGKSLCYQLPALCQDGLTIVISPLIALMKDQVDALTHQNIAATALHSGLSGEEYMAQIERLRQGRVRLLYLAPERLASEGFMTFLRRLPVTLFIVDEAHCISEWGHDFRPSYRTIATAISSFPQRPVIGAFTATATPTVMQDIRHYLKLQNEQTFVTSFDRPNLYFSVMRPQPKLPYLLRFLATHRGQSGIIYCNTRNAVIDLHADLVRKGYAASRYHGGMTEAERTIAQEDFIHDRTPIMVATNAFGMGIDKPDVRYVIHYHIPKSIESYYQEAGRAGRDGLPATCILLFAEADCQTPEYLIEKNGNDLAALDNFEAMKAYARTSQCLRQTLLAHFHHHIAPCGHCQHCTQPSLSEDRTEDVRMILRTVQAAPRAFGKETIIRILRGKLTARDRQYGLQTSPHLGARYDESKSTLQDEIEQLISAGLLTVSGGRYPTIRLTRQGSDVIRGGVPVALRAPIDTVLPKQLPSPTSEINQPLFQRLRDVRTRFAQEKGVPSYIIFQDDTLLEMSSKQPKTLAEMGCISGVGEYKLMMYGQAFLDTITTWRNEHE